MFVSLEFLSTMYIKSSIFWASIEVIKFFSFNLLIRSIIKTDFSNRKMSYVLKNQLLWFWFVIKVY